MLPQKTCVKVDDYWIWIFNKEKPCYKITGKYLFFSTSKQQLFEIAVNEIENHGFHHAKVNNELLEGQTEHVLCLYYQDDSRKHELYKRNIQKYKVKYRYWKSDADTLAGKYSKEFLNALPESQRKDYTNSKC